MKKITSLILSFALLCTVIFPAIKFVTSAEDANIAEKIEALDTAWKELQTKKEEMYFFQYKDNNGGILSKEDINPTLVTDEAEKKMVGSVYKQLNIASTTSFDGEKNRIVYEKSNPNSPKINTISDVLLTYKIEGETTGTPQIEINLTSPNSQMYCVKSDLVADGNWHTIRLSELIGGNWQEKVNSYWVSKGHNGGELYRIFVYHNIMTANITYGVPVILQDSGSYPTDTAGWSATDWYMNAAQVNADNYYFGDAFKTALAELEEALGEDVYLAKLQAGWKAMKVPKTEFNTLYKFENGSSSNNTTDVTVNDLSENDDQKIVGSKTRTFNINSAESFGDLNRIIFKGSSNLSLDDIEDIILSYRVDEVTSGNTNISLGVASNGYKIYKNISAETKIELENDQEWHTVKISECLGSDWKNTVYNSIIWKENESNRKLMWLVIYSDVMEAKITYGTPIILGSNYPTNTNGWTTKDWYLNAAAVDTAKAFDTELFEEAFDALTPTYGQLIVLSDLISAYKKLALKGYGEYQYWKNKDNSGTDHNYTKNDSSLNTPDGVTTEELGTYWQTVDIDSSIAHDGSKNSAIFENTNNIDISTIADGTISYRVDSVAEGSANPTVKLLFCSSDWLTTTSEIFELIADGNWHSFKISDCFSNENWQDAVKSAWANSDKNQLLRIFILHNQTKATISYGNFCVSQKVSMPENTSNWTIADWIAEAEALDRSTLVSTAEIDAVLENAKAVRDQYGVERYHESAAYQNASDLNLTEKINVLSGVKPTIVFNNGNKIVQAAENYSSLTDGAYQKQFKINGFAPAAADTVCYADLSYRFNGDVKVKGMAVAFPAEQTNALKYEIYVSNSEEQLFTNASKVLSYNNISEPTQTLALENTDSPAQAQYFTFENSNLSGRYFGIRFYIDSSFAEANGGYSFSLTELGVYGEETLYSLEKGAFNNQKMQSYGQNLLTKEGVVFKAFVNGTVQNKVTEKNGQYYYGSDDYPVTKITDLNNDTAAGLHLDAKWNSENDKVYLDLVFDLQSLHTINSVLVNNFKNYKDGSPNFYFTGNYEIYISESMSTLTLSKNRVVSYDNTVDSKNGLTQSQSFAFFTPVIGRYVCLRITNPLCDWATAAEKNELKNAYTRLNDVGIFGEVYNKPLKEVNLLEHVPADLYRTDANGTKTAVSEAEYSGEVHKLVYDGSIDEAATIATNSKQLDFFFNLAANMKLNKLTFNTESAQIKEIKFYAADYETKVWSEDSLVYHFKSNTPVDSVIKDFGDSGLEARYVRYSVITVDGTELKVTEIGALGWNTQEFEYRNLIEEQSDAITYYLQEKSNGKFTSFSPAASCTPSGWALNEKVRPLTYLVDGNTHSVTDFYGGENNEKSINLLIDLKDLKAIDSISFFAGSSEDYWPTKLNFYFGRSDMELFNKSAKPAKEYTSKTEDGEYTYEFLPQYAQYVRIEILESKHSYYGNGIISVISELSVNGLQVVSNEGDAVTSFKDPETGVKVDILKLSENDVYEGVQGISVTKRAATADEKKAISGMDMSFEGSLYEVVLLGAYGERVTDLEGRSIRVYLPATDTDGRYVAGIFDGEWALFETAEESGYISAVLDDITYMTFGVAVFGAEDLNDEPVIVDDNSGDVYYDEPIPEEEPEEEPDEIQDTTSKKRVVRKILVDNDNTWLIITLSVVGAVVVAGGVVLTIIVIRKKKKGDK